LTSTPNVDDKLDEIIKEIKKMVDDGIKVAVIKDPRTNIMAIAIENKDVPENHRDRFKIIVKGLPKKIQTILDGVNKKKDNKSMVQENEQELLVDDEQLIREFNKKLVKMDESDKRTRE